MLNALRHWKANMMLKWYAKSVIILSNQLQNNLSAFFSMPQYPQIVSKEPITSRTNHGHLSIENHRTLIEKVMY